MSETVIRRHFRFSGAVQGVGFRWRARHAAAETGVTGWVRNCADGSVEMELQGSRAQLDRVLQRLEESRYIHIGEMEVRGLAPAPEERGFRVLDDRW